MGNKEEQPKASEIILEKMIRDGGTVIVRTLNGEDFNVTISSDTKTFETKKLGTKKYRFDVFDVIIDLLQENNGKAQKGAGRGKDCKLGQAKCGLGTVVGAVAYRYEGAEIGKSIFDPVFVLAAILDWAEICYNKRGFIELRRK